MDSSGLLQDSAPPAGRFRPYASTKHRVTRGRYITSNDPRGYIPVYEYPLNGQWIMMDIDDGYILWTGIWKALGNAKADIVKMLESQPELAPQLRRVRGGYLKIQGTWMPYEVALRLARRVAWPIREDLIPLFGPTFPSTCLSPEQPGYGQILGTQHGRRRGRRTAVTLPLPAPLPPPQTSEFEPSPALGSASQQTQQGVLHRPGALARYTGSVLENQASQLPSPSQTAGPSGVSREDHYEPGRSAHGASSNVQYPYPAAPYDRRPSGLVEPQGLGAYALGHGQSLSHMPPPPAPPAFNRSGPPTSLATHTNPPQPGPIREHRRQPSGQGFVSRFSPYAPSGPERRRSSSSAASHLSGASPMDLPPLLIPPSRARSASGFGSTLFRQRLAEPDIAGTASTSNSGGASTSVSTTSLGESIVLPAIHAYDNSAVSPSASRERSGSLRSTGSGSGYSLPPISALDEPPSSLLSDSSPGRLNSAVVLKRLTLDDELLGRARQRNFADILEEEGAHGNDGETHVPPTHEQLWTRRRSLSAPPLNPDILPRPRTAWSAAPNIRLNTSSSILHPDTRTHSRSSTYNRSPSSYDRGGGTPAEGRSGSSIRTFNQDSPIDDRSSRTSDGPRGFTSMGRSILSPSDVGRRDGGQPSASRTTSNDVFQEADVPFSSASPRPMQISDGDTSTSKSSSSTEKANGGRTPRQPVNYLPTETPRSGSSPRTATSSNTLPGSLGPSRTNSRLPLHLGTSVHLSADLASYRFGGEGQTAPYSRSPSPFNRQKEPDHLPMDVEVDRASYFHSSDRERGTPFR